MKIIIHAQSSSVFAFKPWVEQYPDKAKLVLTNLKEFIKSKSKSMALVAFKRDTLDVPQMVGSTVGWRQRADSVLPTDFVNLLTDSEQDEQDEERQRAQSEFSPDLLELILSRNEQELRDWLNQEFPEGI